VNTEIAVSVPQIICAVPYLSWSFLTSCQLIFFFKCQNTKITHLTHKAGQHLQKSLWSIHDSTD